MTSVAEREPTELDASGFDADPEAKSLASAASAASVGPLTVAASASLAAGLIHVAAVGAHSEHPAAMAVFAATAVVQVGLGVAALNRPSRTNALAFVAVSASALAGWVLAKTIGIPLIDGLDAKESIGLADALAAALALLTAAGALAFLGGLAGRAARSQRRATGIVAVVVAMLSVPGFVSASTHRHADGAEHDHADEATTAAVVPPKPYDPNLPIDLGGVPGVTPEQQAKAENLLAISLLRLPRFADPAVAEAAGFRSIGDGITGYEHFVNWKWIDDDKILDPDYPESLVYRVENGQRTLQAAMFMLRTGNTLDDVPTEIGGRLVQWHIHNNLCYTPDSEAPRVAGLTLPDGTCRAPLVKGKEIPMVHVWIVPHQCGPFAALEGIGAGQIKPGETRLCDHVHGSPAAASGTPSA